MRARNELRPYQEQLVTHLYEHDEAIGVVRPGGGKTVSALTAIAELLRDGIIRHALVTAPKRVVRSVWPEEIEGWEHLRGLTYEVLQDGPAARTRDLADATSRQLTIVGIDVLQWLVTALDHYYSDHPLFDLLVIDEASKLRDARGIRAKALARRAHRWKMIWGLSGTLRPSGPLDLFMPARIVTRGKLWGTSFYKWRATRFYPTDYKQYNWAPLPGAEEALNRDLAPLVCIPEVPPQPEPTIILDRVELPPEARESYNEMQRTLVTGDVLAASAAVATGKLAQIANGFIYGEDGTAQRLHEEKTEWLRDVVENTTGPTILVYEFLEDLRIMREVLGPDLHVLGSEYEIIAAWNARKLPFMAMHPASAGHGLNLQHGGSDMAWFSPTWSPELHEQTIARLNRSGQTEQVIVRICVATGTVDEMKLNRVHHKMTAQTAFETYMRGFQLIAAA
jgi:hypothetical protein